MVIITTSFSKEEIIKETAAGWRNSHFLPTNRSNVSSHLSLVYISRIQGFQELFLTYTSHREEIGSCAGKTTDGWQMILYPALRTMEGLVYQTSTCRIIYELYCRCSRISWKFSKNYWEELKAFCIVNNAGFLPQGLQLQKTYLAEKWRSVYILQNVRKLENVAEGFLLLLLICANSMY